MPNNVINTRSVRFHAPNTTIQSQSSQVRRPPTPPAQPQPRSRNLEVPRDTNILSNLSPFRRTKTTRPTRKIRGYKDTQSRGKKRKTKVKKDKKSKRGSQKKRGRKASKRLRGGVGDDDNPHKNLFRLVRRNLIKQASELDNKSSEKNYFTFLNILRSSNSLQVFFNSNPELKEIYTRIFKQGNAEKEQISSQSQTINPKEKFLLDYISKQFKCAFVNRARVNETYQQTKDRIINTCKLSVEEYFTEFKKGFP